MQWPVQHQGKAHRERMSSPIVRSARRTAACLLLCAGLALFVQPGCGGFDEAAAAFAAGDYPKALQET